MARSRAKATDDPRSRAFGDAVKAVRRERGFSQEAAALACKVDRAYYGKIERGQKWPTLAMIWKLADGLDTQPSKLLDRAEHLLDA
jgi:transcriptional regulator with XRE-family HTH domain